MVPRGTEDSASAAAQLVHVSPFLRVARVTVRLREQQLHFDARVGLEAARKFASELTDAATAARSRAASAAAASAASPAATPTADPASELKLTARVRAGRKLRAELLQRSVRVHPLRRGGQADRAGAGARPTQRRGRAWA